MCAIAVMAQRALTALRLPDVLQSTTELLSALRSSGLSLAHVHAIREFRALLAPFIGMTTDLLVDSARLYYVRALSRSPFQLGSVLIDEVVLVLCAGDIGSVELLHSLRCGLVQGGLVPTARRLRRRAAVRPA